MGQSVGSRDERVQVGRVVEAEVVVLLVQTGVGSHVRYRNAGLVGGRPRCRAYGIDECGTGRVVRGCWRCCGVPVVAVGRCGANRVRGVWCWWVDSPGTDRVAVWRLRCHDS